MPWPWNAIRGRLARRVRRQLQHALLGHIGVESLPIGRSHAGGVIDSVEIGEDGTLSVLGWAPDAGAYAEDVRLSARGESLAASHLFRVTRPDLARLTGDHPEQLGLVLEFVLPPQWSGHHARLTLGSETIASMRLPSFSQPPYCELYGDPGVWHRDDVYGVGPPVKTVSSEILTLCGGLEGPLLDFGCGAGTLVAALRARGIDARGLELDTSLMRNAALPDARDHIAYYTGDFPVPFGDGEFRSLTCCEVLEHVPNFDEAVAELARLTGHRLLITVPDMSAIPRGHSHGVVPWHLLERSHLNFFTQRSLDALLRKHFGDVQFFRIGEIRCSRMRFYTSLVASCRR